jgi:hypothetical protein
MSSELADPTVPEEPMTEARLLLWGETQVGKTTLLATGLLAHPERLPDIDWSADEDDARAVLVRHWGDLSRNLLLEPTAKATDLALPLTNGNRLLVRDIRGGDSINPHAEEAFRQPFGTAQGVLFVIEWEGRDVARHKAAIRSALPLCRGRKVGLAVTKCERGLDADDPHWRAPPGWWREHAFWADHADLLEPFGAQVWPTSSYGYDADGRPACLLGEFGQLIPYQIRPRNVELPFRWFFRELGLS